MSFSLQKAKTLSGNMKPVNTETQN